MRKSLLIGLILLLIPLTTESNIKKIENNTEKENWELIRDQLYELRETLNLLVPTDVYLYKTKMYNKFTLKNKVDIMNYCDSLGIEDPVWLYKTIYRESRGNTKAVNSTSLATGLIQWLPSTALSMKMVNIDGMTFKSIRKRDMYISKCIKEMSMEQQIKYMYEYYKPISKKYSLKSPSCVYLAVFHPNSLGKSYSHIAGTKESLLYRWNPSFDINKDGQITVREMRQRSV